MTIIMRGFREFQHRFPGSLISWFLSGPSIVARRGRGGGGGLALAGDGRDRCRRLVAGMGFGAVSYDE